MNEMIQKTQWTLERASTFADKYDVLYNFAMVVAVFFTILIFGLMTVLCIKYRRTATNQKATQLHGHMGLEIFWTAIPLAIAIVMFFWGAVLFHHAYRAPADAMEIYGVGKQWMWKFQHPSGQREINDLHVPLGKPVEMILTSQDVLHSFYVPAFRVKMDAIPGRYTNVWFEATQKGEFHLFCAEYCGTEHSKMIGKVIVMDPEDYDTWAGGVAWAAEPDLAAKGKAVYKKMACGTCHGAGAIINLAPRLEGVFGKKVVLDDNTSVMVDEDYVRESLLYPKKKVLRGYMPNMPTYKKLLTEEDIVAVIAYIKSLGKEDNQ